MHKSAQVCIIFTYQKVKKNSPFLEFTPTPSYFITWERLCNKEIITNVYSVVGLGNAWNALALPANISA